MASFLAFILDSLFFLVMLFFSNSMAFNKTNALSLKLIPINSPASPFYNEGLNETERLQQLIELSDERVSLWESSFLKGNATLISPENVRFQVYFRRYMYAVTIQIGNNPYKRTFMLVIDTGSDLTWIQCLPCSNCFKQSVPLYDPKLSTSYKRIPCDHHACSPRYRCIRGFCVYSITYVQSSITTEPSTKGILSIDQLWFSHQRHSLLAKNDFVFGCSHESYGFQFDAANYNIGGILGMGTGANSLSSQILDKTDGRFSYCLISSKDHMSQNVISYLKFGDAIIVPEGVPSHTLFITHPKHDHFYYIGLLDISIGGHRMNFPANTFMIKEDGRGGCLIDSGAYITNVVMEAYVRIKEMFAKYYERLNRIKVPGPGGLELCYLHEHTFKRFLSMTYHFQGADFFVHPNYVHFFKEEEKYFCVGLKAAKSETILGALHQQNTRFIYDRRKGELQFISANCAQDQE